MMFLMLAFMAILAGCDGPDRVSAPVVEQTTPWQAGGEVAGSQSALNEQRALIEELAEEYRQLSVPYLREKTFEGSEMQVLSTVSRQRTYTSYIARYESGGLSIQGLLTMPNGDAPEEGFPAVVFVHGYIPPASYRTTEKYEAYVDYLARNGLVVLKIDLRGHGESEGEPGGAYYSSGYVIDTLNAWASLQKLSEVDASRVGLWGHSMGGNVVLRSMAVRPEIHTGVIFAGAVYTYADMAEYGIQDSSYDPSQNPNRGRRSELYDVVGMPSEGGIFWDSVAPANYVADLKGLVSLHHAINDPVVSVEYSRNLADILAQAGARYELHEYETGGHNITNPAFSLAMARSVKALVSN